MIWYFLCFLISLDNLLWGCVRTSCSGLCFTVVIVFSVFGLILFLKVKAWESRLQLIGKVCLDPTFLYISCPPFVVSHGKPRTPYSITTSGGVHCGTFTLCHWMFLPFKVLPVNLGQISMGLLIRSNKIIVASILRYLLSFLYNQYLYIFLVVCFLLFFIKDT